MSRNKFLFLVFFLIFNLNSNLIYAKDPKCPEYILKEFKKYKNHRQLLSIAKKESGFKPNARNGPCIGLMQISSRVWTKELIKKNIIKSAKDLKTIKYNIKAGAYIIAFYKNDYNKYRGIKSKRRINS